MFFFYSSTVLLFSDFVVFIILSVIVRIRINDKIISDDKKIIKIIDFDKKEVVKISFGKKKHFLFKII